jgi:hypothetical protein
MASLPPSGRTDIFARGVAHEDLGPPLGSGSLFLVLGMLAVFGLFAGVQVAVKDRQFLVALATTAGFALPLTITLLRVQRLRRKIGEARLYLPQRYLALGYSGTATYLRPLRDGAALRSIAARLVCKERLETGSARSRRIHEEVLYDEAVEAMATPLTNRLGVQITFRIPEGGPASLMHKKASIRWSLKLHLRMKRCPNARSTFEVQVLPVSSTP